MSLIDEENFRNGTDLLLSLVTGTQKGDVVVPNGATAGGWHVYSSSRGGSWVADEVMEPQKGHTLHIRTADRRGRVGGHPTWHRSYYKTHFGRPTIYCSFTIEDYDSEHHHGGGVGFKLGYNHQDNNTSYYIMFHVDGRAAIYKEGRDSLDASGSGYIVDTARWDYSPGVRRHLAVGQREDGTIEVILDGEHILSGRAAIPVYSGQVALRLDGLDARIHSLVVKPTEKIEEELEMSGYQPSEWAQNVWQWGIDNGLVGGPDAKNPSDPHSTITKQEFVAIMKRFHDRFIS